VKTKTLSKPRGELVITGDLNYALRQIDRRILGDGTKERLEVNRPGRTRPHYPFVPSLTHPDPWGVESYNTNRVHKKVGKKNPSRRK
jgi:hypothetical protein